MTADSEQDTVKLISSDEHVFIIPTEIANQSELLKAMLDPKSPFIEAIERTITLPVKGRLLNRVIDFMNYKFKYRNNSVNAPEFVIEEHETFDLLEISSYLKL